MTDPSPAAFTPVTGPSSYPLLRRAIAVFYAVGAIFLLVAVSSSVDRTAGRSFPSGLALALALVCATVSLRFSAAGWAALLPGRAPRGALLRCVYGSQLGKYVPGGVAQAAGQVAMAIRAGVSTRDALTSYLVYAAHLVMGSFMTGVLLLSQPNSVGWGWSALGALGLLALVPTSRKVIVALLRGLARVVRRLDRLSAIPPQGLLARCLIGQLGFALSQALAFAILLRSIDSGTPIIAAMGAHGLAFGLGLVAIPVPSGLLVREGALVAILHAAVAPSTVVTAAVFHRLVAISGEVIMLGASHLQRRNLVRPEEEQPNVPVNPTQYTGLLSPFLRSRRIRAARPHLQGSVLDVGCADGPLAELIAPERYVGVDLDAAALREARRKHPAHRFEQPEDLRSDERFDTIVALAVLEHISEPAEWLRGWARHLSPGGQLVITTPHATWEPLHGFATKLRLTSPEAQEEHETTFNRESLASTMTGAGLRLSTYRLFLARMNQLAVATKAGDGQPGGA